MKRVLETVIMGTMIAVAAPASAQTQQVATAAAAPIVNQGYIGVSTGGAGVEKFGGLFGLEAGARVWKNLDIVGELSWMSNVVTRTQLDRVEDIAAALGTSQNAPATGTMEVPAIYGGIGARWVFENTGMVRPYALVTFGAVKTELKPTFTLNGADVTSSMGNYGITLGQDVIGEYGHATVSAGGGILVKLGTSWYLDGGVRLTSFSDDDGRVNVTRVLVGGGFRF